MRKIRWKCVIIYQRYCNYSRNFSFTLKPIFHAFWIFCYFRFFLWWNKTSFEFMILVIPCRRIVPPYYPWGGGSPRRGGGAVESRRGGGGYSGSMLSSPLQVTDSMAVVKSIRSPTKSHELKSDKITRTKFVTFAIIVKLNKLYSNTKAEWHLILIFNI